MAAETMSDKRSAGARPASASRYRRSAERSRSGCQSVIGCGTVRVQSRVVPTPRQQAGGLNEASRLLPEGLRLLDERTREVDELIRGAKERAREIVLDA